MGYLIMVDINVWAEIEFTAPARSVAPLDYTFI